ncbi:MAG: VanW family protein [Patescibacteria group bacterium]|nr:VanW family protein [Patescibacteria group bacterium]
MKKIKIPVYFLIGLIVILLGYLSFLAYYNQRIYPGVKIAGILVGGVSPDVAEKMLSANFQTRLNEPLKFTYKDQFFTLIPADSLPEIDLQQKVQQAYSLGRSQNIFQDLRDQFLAARGNIDYPLNLDYGKQTLLEAETAQISQAVNKNPVNAQLVSQDTINVTSSAEGIELDEKELLRQINNYLTFTGPQPTTLPLKTVRPTFTTESAQRYRQVLEDIRTNPIKLHYGNNVWVIDQTTLLSILNFNETKPDLVQAQVDNHQVTIGEISIGETGVTDSQPLVDKDKLAAYLSNLSQQIDQPPQDAKFTIDTTGGQIRVQKFQLAKEGKGLDIDLTAALITQALKSKNNRDINLSVKTTQPKITTADTNSFGITSLLGEGISNFAGSIDNRIYNIGLAASRINGTLIPPGETFSFVKTVGDISGASGYKPAYVIKSGRTVLDDGGGVCQVSTTLFRAILNSGLPVIERTAHAYRVGYYEQGFPPGLDATIFAPSVDLKFKNDTPSYALIQARVSGTTLYVDIYGANDGRITTLTTPKISSQTPPPPELRQDDPTLPKGTVKQVDWAAWGANVSFSRTVTRNGETLISETFKSNYRPWQAVYLVGTKE